MKYKNIENVITRIVNYYKFERAHDDTILSVSYYIFEKTGKIVATIKDQDSLELDPDTHTLVITWKEPHRDSIKYIDVKTIGAIEARISHGVQLTATVE